MTSPAEPISRRDRPAKAPLSRRSILDAAVELIRVRGVAAVTLKDVAEAVQTGPASLYAYFRNRDELLECVLDAAYAQVELVHPLDGDWRGALATTIVNTIEKLESFPGLATVALGAIPTREGALRLAEHELTLMELGGIDADAAALGVDLIAQFAAATAIERAVPGKRERGHTEREQLKAAYGGADPQVYPRVARLASALTAPDEPSRRDFAIQAILNGLTSTPYPPTRPTP